MNPILIIKCKIKIIVSIVMVVFGATLLGISIDYLLTRNYWWFIGLFIGIFCLVNWTNILIKGGRTLVFYVKDNVLFFTYERTKIVAEQLDNIKATTFYTSQYNLEEINSFWRYLLKINGGVTSDILHFKYQGKKIEVADLVKYEVKLQEEDLAKIAMFLRTHNPNIQIGK